MALTATLTGTAGPAVTVTSQVFTGVSDFTIHSLTNMIELVQESATRFVSVNAATTVTATKSGFTWTIVVS